MDFGKLDSKAVIKLVIFSLIIIVVVILGIKYAPLMIKTVENPQYVRDYLAGFGNAGFLVFILIQVIQVIIVIIPGDIVSVCAGFIYGIPIGFVLTYIGLMLGTVIVFYFSRFFGYDIVSRLIAKEKIDRMSLILNSKRGSIGMFIICSFPFIPKDILMYVAGLTPVKASRLFLIYGLSRIPATLIWVSIGAKAFEKDLLGLGITIAVMLILLVIMFFLGKNYHRREISKKEE